MSGNESRRPLKSRLNPLAIKTASFLSKKNITPNQISVLSIFFSLIGGIMILIPKSPFGLVLGALCIQARLLCNLLDGMIAIEGGKKTPTGVIFNELPDRVSDSILITALGYAADLGWLGWTGALLALSTAYVRAFGGSLGLDQDFSGPMAKQHRMAVMTAGCIIASLESAFLESAYSLALSSFIIALGSALTCISRIRKIAALVSEGDR